MRICAGTLFCMILLGVFAYGQERYIPLANDVASKYVVKRVEPIYPAIAQAARITGTVEMKVEISASGDVRSVKVLSGPPMLQQAAMDAVKQWKYQPYMLAGQPVGMITDVSIQFGSTPQTKADKEEVKINRKVSPLMTQCINLLNARDPNSLEPCRKTAELSDKYPLDRRYMDRMVAHDEYGIALLFYAHKPQQALDEFQKEIALAPKALKDTDAEWAGAYWHRGLAYAQLGNLNQADEDFSVAEDSFRKAEVAIGSKVMAERYDHTLQRVVAQHAAILEKMGRHAEAQKLLDGNK